eukprot:TRINITY_DN21233_c0_g1_i1.p1 TRINITY_DN21233_c0_g1~~TRINITY_DN21233_c0_g1_i1.p1  ORF type:complete len:247 (-),score=57.51 TRINITY_DN21233_c0_g1_i1:13-753(-)
MAAAASKGHPFVQVLPFFVPPTRWAELLQELRAEVSVAGLKELLVVSDVSNWGGEKDETLHLAVLTFDTQADAGLALPATVRAAQAESAEQCKAKYDMAIVDNPKMADKITAEQFAEKFASMNGGSGKLIWDLRAEHQRPSGHCVVWRSDAAEENMEDLSDLLLQGTVKGLLSVQVVQCQSGSADQGPFRPFLVVSTFETAEDAAAGAQYGAPVDDETQGKVMALTAGLGLVNAGPVAWQLSFAER